jgi:hypothetical protein
MNKHEKMMNQIESHGNDLARIFWINGADPVKLSKQVHAIEVKAHKLATDYCNGENGVDSETWEPLTDKILDRLDKILNFRAQNIPVFVNGDARGYALKIDDEYVRKYGLKIHTDWGGYGILAPEFDGE